MINFWATLPKPFLVLAPMEDVTDVVFREIVATLLPRPDVFFTEFTNADGLASRGRDRVIQKLKYTNAQRPVVAQIWGINPDNMYSAARLVEELGFDGVDINFGCPVPAVVKKGAGAGTIGDYSLAKELIDAVKRAAQNIPVSVKTRLGNKTIITEEWCSFLLEQKLDALILHGRTAVQMSKGDADWGEIGKATALRNTISPDTIIIGNGDIKSYKQAVDVSHKYEVDGVMVGRGIFSDPWVFEKISRPRSRKDYIDLMVDHIKLYEKTWGKTKNFEVMKKFFKMYVKNFEGANELRQRLMECKKSSDARSIINSYIKQNTL